MYFLTLETTSRISASEASAGEDASGPGGRLVLGCFEVGPGVGSEAWGGALRSKAPASRWLRTGTWASKHRKSQKTKSVRTRLQVDTLQIQYFCPKEMGFLQVVHLRQVLGSFIS